MENNLNEQITQQNDQLETPPLIEQPILSKEDCIAFLADMVEDLDGLLNGDVLPHDVEALQRSIEFNNSLLYHLTN